MNGCFWHQHSACREGRLPGSRVDYWGPKLARNQERDSENLLKLSERGWNVLVVWECETIDRQVLQHRIRSFLGEYPKTKGSGLQP